MNNHASATEGLSIEKTDGILTIAFDRPARRNSISFEMYDMITAALHDAGKRDSVRCVLFTGTGSIFCAGHDVGGFGRGLAMHPEEKPTFGFMLALSTCPVPVIAALNGDAIGIAATMLFHCDLVYAVPDARLVFPFMQMGLVPEFASTHLLPAMIGPSRAMELFMLGGRATAQEALEWGLVNALIDHADLRGRSTEAARAIVALSPDAVRQTKRLVRAGTAGEVRRAIGEEAHVFHELLSTDHAKDFFARFAKGKQPENGK